MTEVTVFEKKKKNWNFNFFFNNLNWFMKLPGPGNPSNLESDIANWSGTTISQSLV